MDLQELFKKEGLELTDDKVNKFNEYTKILLEYNKVMNLTAITEPSEINLKHYLDSVLPILTGYFKEGMKVCDVGCGAGFPSIPLKIYMPELDFTLIDSLNKRINFLNEVIRILDLKDIRTIHMRAEDAGRDENLREKFDISVARAVAPLNVLLEYCTPFVKKGGYFIALKGKDAKNELLNSKNAMEKLSVELVKTLDTTLSGTDNMRSIMVFKKLNFTKKAYPRQAGKPSKNPL